MTDDDLLQRLYDLAAPNARKRPVKEPLDAPVDEVMLYWRACGITYERDDLSIIPDDQYDGLAWWLGERYPDHDFSAATAMDWKWYPPEAFEMAAKLKAAVIDRRRPVVCSECWVRDQEDCTCLTRRV